MIIFCWSIRLLALFHSCLNVTIYLKPLNGLMPFNSEDTCVLDNWVLTMTSYKGMRVKMANIRTCSYFENASIIQLILARCQNVLFLSMSNVKYSIREFTNFRNTCQRLHEYRLVNVIMANLCRPLIYRMVQLTWFILRQRQEVPLYIT